MPSFKTVSKNDINILTELENVDKINHKKGINQAMFCKKRNKLFVLDNNSSKLLAYGPELGKAEIVMEADKDFHFLDSVILDFAYSDT